MNFFHLAIHELKQRKESIKMAFWLLAAAMISQNQKLLKIGELQFHTAKMNICLLSHHHSLTVTSKHHGVISSIVTFSNLKVKFSSDKPTFDEHLNANCNLAFQTFWFRWKMPDCVPDIFLMKKAGSDAFGATFFPLLNAKKSCCSHWKSDGKFLLLGQWNTITFQCMWKMVLDWKKSAKAMLLFWLNWKDLTLTLIKS